MKQKIIGLAISLLTVFIVAELFSLGWYFLSSWSINGRGELFYLSDRPDFSTTAKLPGNALLTDTRIHPFFGWVRQDHHQFNNHGFLTPYTYPFVKQHKDQYIIGLFGGSVAELFSKFGTEHLIQRLKADPFFAGREIIVLNFGMGGYKQPQQLFVLSYYLTTGQEFDLVVNIDGFNEVALSNLNQQRGANISMPSAHHMRALVDFVSYTSLTQERLEVMTRLNQNKATADRIAQRMERTSLASVYFVYKQLYKIFFDRFSYERLRLAELETAPPSESLIFIRGAEPPEAGSSIFEQMGSQWLSASLMMDDILKGRQIPYVHILQPNQYYSKKVFSADEAKIALREDQPYRPGVEQGYPVLVVQAEKLKQAGVNFYSAIDIFDDRTEIVYSDDCCHFNQQGNELLADFMAEAILTVLKRK